MGRGHRRATEWPHVHHLPQAWYTFICVSHLHMCIRHGRKIAVNNGEVLGHKGRLIDPNDDLSSLKLKNPTMPPQRTHRVTIDEGRTMVAIL